MDTEATMQPAQEDAPRRELARASRSRGAEVPPTTVIEPRPAGPASALRELWLHRHFVWYFSRRNIEKRYARTWLGWIWIPLRPALTIGSQVLIFGALLNAPSNGVPYLLFFVVGSSMWQLFATTLYWGTRSIELNRGLLSRQHVPRLTTLAAAPAPGLLDLALYAIIAALVSSYYVVSRGRFYLEITAATPLLALVMVLVILLALAISLFTAVYGAEMRDVRFGLGYVLNVVFFLTPVVYPLNKVPEGYRTVAELNPLTAPMELTREALFGTGTFSAVGLASTITAIVVIGAAGLLFYARAEQRAVEQI